MNGMNLRIRQVPSLKDILYIRHRCGCGLMTAKTMAKANPDASLDAIADAIKNMDLHGRGV